MNTNKLMFICMIAAAVAAVVTTFVLKALGVEETALIAGGVGGAIGGVFATRMNQKKDTA